MAATPARKPMLTVRAALDHLLGAVRPVTDVESIATLAANGRVLATAQAATINVPSADNTQMDGYAVRAADCASGAAPTRGRRTRSAPGRGRARYGRSNSPWRTRTGGPAVAER